MPFTMTAVEVPDKILAPKDSRPYLVGFVEWVRDFFKQIADESVPFGDFANIFVPSQISYLPQAMSEISSLFENVIGKVKMMSETAIREHGLYGIQLQWKFSNVNYWLERFLDNSVYKVFDWLLDAIDSVLESILDGIPGGGAVIELKEAIRNAIDKTSDI